jgi:hypothetical protein
LRRLSHRLLPLLCYRGGTGIREDEMMNMRIYWRAGAFKSLLAKRIILKPILLSQWRSLNPAITAYAQKVPALPATVSA